MTLSLSTSFLPTPAAARTTARTLRSVVPSQVRTLAHTGPSLSQFLHGYPSIGAAALANS